MRIRVQSVRVVRIRDWTGMNGRDVLQFSLEQNDRYSEATDVFIRWGTAWYLDWRTPFYIRTHRFITILILLHDQRTIRQYTLKTTTNHHSTAPLRLQNHRRRFLEDHQIPETRLLLRLAIPYDTTALSLISITFLSLRNERFHYTILYDTTWYDYIL